jgi:two-component system, chemotaxis family, response regulator Rcp1
MDTATSNVMEWLVMAGLQYDSAVPEARIFVIEDNGSDVFLLERALKKQPLRFELSHLQDGGEALAFVRQEGAWAEAPLPDLILLDLTLPRYNGEDILREIRAAKHLANVPVCVWSSSHSRRDRLRIIGLGAAWFVTKPCGLDQFMQIGKAIKDLLTCPGAAESV